MERVTRRELFVPREISDLSVARLLPVESLFFYVGLIALGLLTVVSISRARWVIYAALVITLIPAVITEDNPNIMRASAFAVLSPLFSAAGIVWLYSKAAGHRQVRRFYYPAVGSAIALTAAVIILRYSQSIMFREAHFQNFLVLLNTKVGGHQQRYSRVYMERCGTVDWMYTIAFTGIKPAQYQAMQKEFWSDGMDHFTRVGKFHFRSKA